ncbi:MAG: hypothetical protein KME54_04615 [Tolypothrix brevis GSE-NOS-MK-07-07A]|nr:hypothetical protein [Tolypothrix brevis GSE-NOS-MK-07-07A]
MPRMQGRPPHCRGLTVILESSSAIKGSSHNIYLYFDTLRSVRPWRLPLAEDTQIL